MSDILPSDSDLARMTPADIGKRLSTYRGIPLEALEANVNPLLYGLCCPEIHFLPVSIASAQSARGC